MSDSNLLNKIDADLKDAMRSRDETAKLTLRAIKSAVLEVVKAEDGPATVTDELVVEAVQQEAKRRRDAIVQYEKAGRQELAAKEAAELVVLERYLPRQLSETEIEALARTVIAEVGATSMRDMGQIMGRLMPQVAGLADGRQVNQVLKRLLA